MADYGPYPANERTTSTFSADIQDENGAAIPAASLTDITLTLYDEVSRQVINGRSAVSVKNASGGTVDTAGHFEMVFELEDNAHMGGATNERHVALFRYTYDSGAKAGAQRVLIDVFNEPKVS